MITGHVAQHAPRPLHGRQSPHDGHHPRAPGGPSLRLPHMRATALKTWVKPAQNLEQIRTMIARATLKSDPPTPARGSHQGPSGSANK